MTCGSRQYRPSGGDLGPKKTDIDFAINSSVASYQSQDDVRVETAHRPRVGIPARVDAIVVPTDS